METDSDRFVICIAIMLIYQFSLLIPDQSDCGSRSSRDYDHRRHISNSQNRQSIVASQSDHILYRSDGYQQQKYYAPASQSGFRQYKPDSHLDYGGDGSKDDWTYTADDQPERRTSVLKGV